MCSWCGILSLHSNSTACKQNKKREWGYLNSQRATPPSSLQRLKQTYTDPPHQTLFANTSYMYAPKYAIIINHNH